MEQLKNLDVNRTVTSEEIRKAQNLLDLNETIIERIKKESVEAILKTFQENIIEIILYGSCARGDFTKDSDIDIALLLDCTSLDCTSMETNDFLHDCSKIATELAMKYYQVVNFVCLPYDAYLEKREWYSYFHNISEEGVSLWKRDIGMN